MKNEKVESSLVEDGAVREVGDEGGEGNQCLFPHGEGSVHAALVKSQHILQTHAQSHRQDHRLCRSLLRVQRLATILLECLLIHVYSIQTAYACHRRRGKERAHSLPHIYGLLGW